TPVPHASGAGGSTPPHGFPAAGSPSRLPAGHTDHTWRQPPAFCRRRAPVTRTPCCTGVHSARLPPSGRSRIAGPPVCAHLIDNMLSIGWPSAMTTHDAARFRRFTRAIFAAQAAVLKHGDVATAPFGQSSARWRVLFRVSHGATTVAAIARATGYSRQAVQRLA